MADPTPTPAYSYNPADLAAPSVSKMRFELGDTNVSESGKHAALCDQEYQAIIDANPDDWGRACYKAADYIYRRFAREVSFSAAGVRYELQQRTDNWRQIRDEIQRRNSGGSATNPGFVTPQSDQDNSYFRLGMHDNPFRGR